jgi:hypothetical protein
MQLEKLQYAIKAYKMPKVIIEQINKQPDGTNTRSHITDLESHN